MIPSPTHTTGQWCWLLAGGSDEPLHLAWASHSTALRFPDWVSHGKAAQKKMFKEAQKEAHDLALNIPVCNMDHKLLVKQTLKSAQIQDEWKNK